jgi:hypothetical protein
MAVSWSSPYYDDDEPATPSTAFIAMDVSLDSSTPVGFAVARRPMEPVPYAEPDELQDDVIEPTASTPRLSRISTGKEITILCD